MENEVLEVDQNNFLPTISNLPTVLANDSRCNPYQKNTDDFNRIASGILPNILKEGIANIKSTRILNKKIIESEIDTTTLNLQVQHSEYERVKSRLEEKELTPEEQMYLEKRIETLSDRIDERVQTYNISMNESKFKQCKILPTGTQIAICALCFLGGFVAGLAYQSRA